jgi:thioredoxin 1
MQTADYAESTLSRAAVEAGRGLLLLDFGTEWCGHCMAARAAVDAWVAAHPGLRHLRIVAGPGRPLGRSFRVKLWPSLVLLRDGAELARVVRPREARDLFPLDQALPPAPGPAGVVA